MKSTCLPCPLHWHFGRFVDLLLNALLVRSNRDDGSGCESRNESQTSRSDILWEKLMQGWWFELISCMIHATGTEQAVYSDDSKITMCSLVSFNADSRRWVRCKDWRSTKSASLTANRLNLHLILSGFWIHSEPFVQLSMKGTVCRNGLSLSFSLNSPLLPYTLNFPSDTFFYGGYCRRRQSIRVYLQILLLGAIKFLIIILRAKFLTMFSISAMRKDALIPYRRKDTNSITYHTIWFDVLHYDQFKFERNYAAFLVNFS